MSEREKDGGFKVVDRRRFDESGDVRSGSDAAQAVPPTAEPVSEIKKEPAQPAAPQGEMPPMEFAHFCLSLATSAQMALGLIPHPEGQVTSKDLPMARQTIDVLAMLQDKTKGNLSAEESQLLEELLYMLRMQYVEAGKQTGK